MDTTPNKRIKLSRDETNILSENVPRSSKLEGMSDPVPDCSVPDFPAIVKTSGFIDKTLLIKALFENSCKVLITAPRRFGKSTNLDMVKRFLEIVVDGYGKPLNTFSTDNYKLFSENKLKIMEHEQFCKQHLGKHPVIIIDYKPLNESYDFDSMLTQLDLIVKETFGHHQYLLNVSNFWSGNLKLERFKGYLEGKKALDVHDLKCAFTFIAEALHKYFGKPVFVLIDDYLSFVNGFVIRENADMIRIINFVQSMTAEFLKSSNHIDHALLTGVIGLSSEGLPLSVSQCLNGIIHHKFLYNHPFCLYFGLTSKELDRIVKKVTKNVEEADKCKRTINKYFNGYEVKGKNHKIYCPWSVMKFFENNRKIRKHCCRDDYILFIKPLFRLESIAYKIKELVFGKFPEADISKPLAKSNIQVFHDILKSLDSKIDFPEDRLFLFLYHLGYLSISEIKSKHSFSLKIPNQEIFFQFVEVFKESLEIKYKFDSKCIENFQRAVNSFHKSKICEDKFETFSMSINNLFQSSIYPCNTNNNFLFIIFIFLACRFSFIRSDTSKSTSVRQDFMVVNDHDLALFIDARMEKPGGNEKLEDLLMNVHNQLVTKQYYNSVQREFKKKLRGKIYMGILYRCNKTISLCYSFLTNDDDSVSVPKII